MASDCSWGKSRRPAVALRVIGVFDQYLAGIRSLGRTAWTGQMKIKDGYV